MLVTNNTAGILIGKGGSALKEGHCKCAWLSICAPAPNEHLDRPPFAREDLEASTGCLVRLSPANNFYPGSRSSCNLLAAGPYCLLGVMGML